MARQSWELVDRSESNGSVLNHDKAAGTKRLCIAGLVCSLVISFTMIVSGLVLGSTVSEARPKWNYFKMTNLSRALMSLGFNVVTTTITESLGYVHGTGLRWALWNEKRLHFNTNLRLWTYSRNSFPNGRICNIPYFICTAICYAASGMIIVEWDFSAASSMSASGWNFLGIDLTVLLVAGFAVLIEHFFLFFFGVVVYQMFACSHMDVESAHSTYNSNGIWSGTSARTLYDGGPRPLPCQQEPEAVSPPAFAI